MLGQQKLALSHLIASQYIMITYHCDSNAIFVKSRGQGNGGVCYSYDVMESVCIGVTYKVDEETATYGW